MTCQRIQEAATVASYCVLTVTNPFHYSVGQVAGVILGVANFIFSGLLSTKNGTEASSLFLKRHIQSQKDVGLATTVIHVVTACGRVASYFFSCLKPFDAGISQLARLSGSLLGFTVFYKAVNSYVSILAPATSSETRIGR